MTSFPEPQPHGAFEELFPDVFVVTGSHRVAPLMTIPRNMIVLREGRSLTLVNAVRLTAAGEAALEALGTVTQLVKLGHYHTRDDPYYRDRFKPTFWAPRPKDSDTRALVDGARGPIERTRVFTFEKTAEGEAALILEQPGGNLLVTCDSVQHWPDASGCSLAARVVIWQSGFTAERAKIGPIWVQEQTGKQPSKLWPDFERLLARDFQHLISGHGRLLRGDAKESVERSVTKVVKPR